MIKFHRLLISLGFTCFLSLQVFAEAPVVDESEGFAIFDEQQASLERPVAKAQPDEADEAIALAQDNHEGSNVDSSELVNKLQGLQQDIQELRGQLEVQAHDLKLLQQQQLTFYKDLDTRLREGPNKPAQTAQLAPTEQSKPELALDPPSNLASTEPLTPSKPGTTVETANLAQRLNRAHGNPAEEQISYLAAYELVKNKHFDEALTAMQSFIAHYPHGGYTANAQYWLGELYLVKHNYAQAIVHFERVLKQFPSSSKAAASTLKIGYALAASGRKNEARIRLQQVLKNYPDTPTAQLATLKLESLGLS